MSAPTPTPMTILQAAKVLARYPNQTRDRETTGYGTVYECSCCRYALNVSRGGHADDCQLAAAMKVIGEPDEDEDGA